MKKLLLSTLYLTFGYPNYIHFLAAEHLKRCDVSKVFELGCGNGNIALSVLMVGAKDYVGFDTRDTLKNTIIWKILTFFKLASFKTFHFFLDSSVDDNIVSSYQGYFFVSTGLIQALEPKAQLNFLRIASQFNSGFVSFPYIDKVRGHSSHLTGVEGCLEFPVDMHSVTQIIPSAKIVSIFDTTLIIW